MFTGEKIPQDVLQNTISNMSQGIIILKSMLHITGDNCSGYEMMFMLLNRDPAQLIIMRY